MSCHATVIICSKNRARQLETCLSTLAAMATRDFEVVIVNDASTDDTPAVLDAFQSAHADIPCRMVTNEISRGLSAARNVGIDAARGDLLFFIDTDCTVCPGWLSSFAVAFEDPAVWAASGPVIEPVANNLAERAFNGTSAVGPASSHRRGLAGGNMGFRRDVAAHIRFDEAMTFFCEEDDIGRRIVAAGGRIGHAPEAVVEHHHPQTMGGFLGRAFRHGHGSARYWYKHDVYVGRDILFLVLAIVTLPLGLWHGWLWLVPGAFLCLQGAALMYNEIALKGKSLGVALSVLPVVVAYSVLKVCGTATGMVRIALGIDRPMIESKRKWRSERRSPWSPAATTASS